MNKKQLQTESTKKRIADAARAFFTQKGYKATSIEEIVKATGCSAGNIYYHFKSKEGLFLYLLQEGDREWEETWLAKETLYPTTADKLYGLAEHFALDQFNQPLKKAIDEFIYSDKAAEVEERLNEMVQGYISFNQELLQQGIDSGEFDIQDVRGLSIVLDSLLIGLNQHSRRMEHDEALAAYRLGVDVFLHGIARQRGGQNR